MILKGLALGFSTGIFCLGFCFPILGPLILSREDATIRGTSLSLSLFIFGRLAAYLIFGLFVGILGQYAKEALFFQTIVIPALFIVLGIVMIVYGLVQIFPHAALCRMAKKRISKSRSFFIVGFLAGINVCPPFLLALSYAMSVGAIAKSMIFFLFFFIATTMFFLPFLFSGMISRFEEVRIAARITAVIAGCWFIFLGVQKMAVMN
jgi:sulfite exporter TauE/SafE